MISSVVLAALSFVPLHPGYPERVPLRAAIDGRPQVVLGWLKDGQVWHFRDENPHLADPQAPRPTLMPGVVSERDGSLNSGVSTPALNAMASGQLDTNDLREAKRFAGTDAVAGERCPNNQPCPEPGPDEPDAPDEPEHPAPSQQDALTWLGFGLLAAALFLWFVNPRGE